MNSDSDINCYLNFKAAVKDAANYASKGDLRTIIRSLTVCLGNLPKDFINVTREIFEINLLMIEMDIFVEDNGYLMEIHFNKFIIYSCTCKRSQQRKSL